MFSKNNKKIVANEEPAAEDPRNEKKVSLDILLAELEGNAPESISPTPPRRVHVGGNNEEEGKEEGGGEDKKDDAEAEKSREEEDDLSGVDELDFKHLMENVGDEELFNSFMERMKKIHFKAAMKQTIITGQSHHHDNKTSSSSLLSSRDRQIRYLDGHHSSSFSTPKQYAFKTDMEELMTRLNQLEAENSKLREQLVVAAPQSAGNEGDDESNGIYCSSLEDEEEGEGGGEKEHDDGGNNGPKQMDYEKRQLLVVGNKKKVEDQHTQQQVEKRKIFRTPLLSPAGAALDRSSLKRSSSVVVGAQTAIQQPTSVDAASTPSARLKKKAKPLLRRLDDGDIKSLWQDVLSGKKGMKEFSYAVKKRSSSKSSIGRIFIPSTFPVSIPKNRDVSAVLQADPQLFCEPSQLSYDESVEGNAVPILNIDFNVEDEEGYALRGVEQDDQQCYLTEFLKNCCLPKPTGRRPAPAASTDDSQFMLAAKEMFNKAPPHGDDEKEEIIDDDDDDEEEEEEGEGRHDDGGDNKKAFVYFKEKIEKGYSCALTGVTVMKAADEATGSYDKGLILDSLSRGQPLPLGRIYEYRNKLCSTVQLPDCSEDALFNAWLHDSSIVTKDTDMLFESTIASPAMSFELGLTSANPFTDSRSLSRHSEEYKGGVFFSLLPLLVGSASFKNYVHHMIDYESSKKTKHRWSYKKTSKLIFNNVDSGEASSATTSIATRIIYGPFEDEKNKLKLENLCKRRFNKGWAKLIQEDDGNADPIFLDLPELVLAGIDVWVTVQRPGNMIIFGPNVKYFSSTVGFALTLSWNYFSLDALDLPFRMFKGGDLMWCAAQKTLSSVNWNRVIEMNLKALKENYFRLTSSSILCSPTKAGSKLKVRVQRVQQALLSIFHAFDNHSIYENLVKVGLEIPVVQGYLQECSDLIQSVSLMLIDEPLEHKKKAAAVPSSSSMLPNKGRSSRRGEADGKEPLADEDDKERRKSIMHNNMGKDSSSEQSFKIIRALVPVISEKEKKDDLKLGLEGVMNSKFSRTLIQIGLRKDKGSTLIAGSGSRKNQQLTAPLLLENPHPLKKKVGAADVLEPALKYDEMISKFVFTMLPATSSTCGVEDIRTEELATDFINSNLPTRQDRAEFYSCTIQKVYQVQRMQDMNKIMQALQYVALDGILHAEYLRFASSRPVMETLEQASTQDRISLIYSLLRRFFNVAEDGYLAVGKRLQRFIKSKTAVRKEEIEASINFLSEVEDKPDPIPVLPSWPTLLQKIVNNIAAAYETPLPCTLCSEGRNRGGYIFMSCDSWRLREKGWSTANFQDGSIGASLMFKNRMGLINAINETDHFTDLQYLPIKKWHYVKESIGTSVRIFKFFGSQQLYFNSGLQEVLDGNFTQVAAEGILTKIDCFEEQHLLCVECGMLEKRTGPDATMIYCSLCKTRALHVECEPIWPSAAEYFSRDRSGQEDEEKGIICSPCIMLLAKLLSCNILRLPEDEDQPLYSPLDTVQRLFRYLNVPAALSPGILGFGWRMQVLMETKRCSSCFDLSVNDKNRGAALQCLFSYFKNEVVGIDRSALINKHWCYGDAFLCGNCTFKYKCNPMEGIFFLCPVCYEMYDLSLNEACITHLKDKTGCMVDKFVFRVIGIRPESVSFQAAPKDIYLQSLRASRYAFTITTRKTSQYKGSSFLKELYSLQKRRVLSTSLDFLTFRQDTNAPKEIMEIFNTEKTFLKAGQKMKIERWWGHKIGMLLLDRYRLLNLGAAFLKKLGCGSHHYDSSQLSFSSLSRASDNEILSLPAATFNWRNATITHKDHDADYGGIDDDIIVDDADATQMMLQGDDIDGSGLNGRIVEQPVTSPHFPVITIPLQNIQIIVGERVAELYLHATDAKNQNSEEVICELNHIRITCSHLFSLVKNDFMLNDEIISAYSSLVTLTATANGGTTSHNGKQYVFASYLFTRYYPPASESHFDNWKGSIDESLTHFDGVRRWTKNIGSLSSYKRLFFPCHIANIPHWALLKLDVEHRTIHYYDSLYNEHRASFYCSLLQSYLSKAFTEVAEWTFKYQHHVTAPRQKNCVDCGVYLLAFLECLYYTDAIPAQFSSEDALNFRRYIALKFVENGNNRGVATEVAGGPLPWPILLEKNAKMEVVDPAETFEESDNLLDLNKISANNSVDEAPETKDVAPTPSNKRSYQFLSRGITLPSLDNNREVRKQPRRAGNKDVPREAGNEVVHYEEGAKQGSQGDMDMQKPEGAEAPSSSPLSLKGKNDQLQRPRKGILNRNIPVTTPVVEKQAECLLQALREKYKISFLRQDVFLPRNLFTILKSVSLDNELKLVDIPEDGNCYFTSTLMIIQEAQLRPRNDPGNGDIIQDAEELRLHVIQKVLEQEDNIKQLLQRRYVASYDLTGMEADVGESQKKREEYEKALKDPKIPVEVRALSMEYPELQSILDVDITKDTLDPLYACLMSEAYWADEIMMNIVESNFFEGRFVRMKINSPSKDTPNYWWPYEVNSADIVDDDGDRNEEVEKNSVKTTSDHHGRRIPRYPEGIILHYNRVHFEIVQQEGKCIVDLRNHSIVHDLFNLTVFNDDE